MTARFQNIQLLRQGFGFDDIAIKMHRPPGEVRDFVADVDFAALYGLWRREWRAGK